MRSVTRGAHAAEPPRALAGRAGVRAGSHGADVGAALARAPRWDARVRAGARGVRDEGGCDARPGEGDADSRALSAIFSIPPRAADLLCLLLRRARSPPHDEVLGVHRVQVLPHRTGEAAHAAGREVPQEHGLAVGDVDDLDGVAAHEQPVGRLGSHAADVAAAARAAAGSPASPWKTCPPTAIAGTSRTHPAAGAGAPPRPRAPRRAAVAVSRASASRTERRPPSLRTEAGCISHAAAAI